MTLASRRNIASSAAAAAAALFIVASVLGGVANATSSAGTFSVVSNTPCVTAGSTTTITETIKNLNASTSSNKIGSIFLDGLKTNFYNITLSTPAVFSTAPGGTVRTDWTAHKENAYSGSDNNADLDAIYLTANNATTAPIAGQGQLTVTFTATIGTPTGAKSLTDSAWTGTTPRAGSAFTVSANTVNVAASCGPAHISFVTPPSDTKANATMSPAVTVKVTDGTNAPVANDPVKLTSTGLSTSPSATVNTNASGIASFSALTVQTTPGSYTMTASDATLTTGAASFNISAGTPEQIAFVTGPFSTHAGQAMSDVTVSVTDHWGNPVSGDAVKLASTGLATSPTGTQMTGANGQVTFTGSALTVGTTGGPYTMTASDAAASSAPAPFNISAAAPNTIVFVTGPADTTAGNNMADVTVKVTDQYGNPVNADPVTLKSPGLNTSPTSPSVTDATGQVTFSGATLKVVTAAGPYTLTATDGVASPDASATFNVNADVAANVTFVTPPGDTKANETMAAVVVSVTDSHGNPVANDPISLSSTGLATNPSATLATDSSGKVTFSSLQVGTIKGTYGMTASDGSHTSGSASFKILAGDPASLTFSAQPTDTLLGDAVNGSSGGVRVSVTDTWNNPVADGTNVVVSIGTDPTGAATLNGVAGGTETQPTSGGVSTFSDLKIAPTSSGFTLHAVAGAASGDSATFAITNTDSGCTNDCTATFPNGTSTVSAPAGTTLIIESNQLDCSGVANPIAGTVTIIPDPNTVGATPVVFNDTIHFPITGLYPFCKTPNTNVNVPFCDTISNGLDQDANGVACVTETIILHGSSDPTLHSVLYIDATDPGGKH